MYIYINMYMYIYIRFRGLKDIPFAERPAARFDWLALRFCLYLRLTSRVFAALVFAPVIVFLPALPRVQSLFVAIFSAITFSDV